MTKSEPKRRFRIGIKGKIWIAIMAIVIAVIASIWILQDLFLRDYTARIKREEFVRLLQTVNQTVSEKGFALSAVSLYDLVGKNNLCIRLLDENQVQVSIEGLPYSCYVHYFHATDGTEKALLQKTVDSGLAWQVEQVTQEEVGDYLLGLIYGVTRMGGARYAGLVVQPMTDVNKATAVIRDRMVLVSALLGVIATVIAFLVAQSITHPLRRIAGAARQIAEGALGVTVDVRSKDEIGDLGENFNQMSREISKVNTLQRELVANISHDMRTPLTMIRGYAEMIKDITGEDKAAREEQLDIIIDESNRLSTLVSGVMDLSLMQAGQVEMRLRPFDLASKCRDILARFSLLEQTEGFEFVLDAGDEAWVEGDEVRIEQVLYNLINNAVNHIGGQKRIIVRLLPADGLVRVEVEDTGAGIAQEDLALIWDRYYKPYKKGQKQQGTGLGLSIVKAILQNHRSQFGVNSTLGVGSTFWFTLRPAKKPEAGSEGGESATKRKG